MLKRIDFYNEKQEAMSILFNPFDVSAPQVEDMIADKSYLSDNRLVITSKDRADNILKDNIRKDMQTEQTSFSIGYLDMLNQSAQNLIKKSQKRFF